MKAPAPRSLALIAMAYIVAITGAMVAGLAGKALADPQRPERLYASPPLPPGGVQAWRKALLSHRMPAKPSPDPGRSRPDTVGVYDLIEVTTTLAFDGPQVPEMARYEVTLEARQPLEAVPLLAVFYEAIDVRDSAGRALRFATSPEMGEMVIFLDRPLRAGERATYAIDAALTYACDLPPGCIEEDGYLHIADGLWYPMSFDEPVDDRFLATLHLETRLPQVPSGTGARLGAAVIEAGLYQASFRTEVVTFLPAFSVGDYRVAQRGRTETFSPAEGVIGAETLSDIAESSLDFYGDLFVPYPFARLGMAAIATGAGAGIGPQANILLPDVFWTIDPRDATLGAVVRDVTSHEIGHQYFFNLIGVVDNGEGWMSEGFAEYASIRYAEHVTGDTDAARVNYWTYVLTVPPDEDEPMHSEAVSASPWYFELVYLKGSTVLHALRQRFGSERWDTAFALYVAAFARQITTTDEFERFMSIALGDDLRPFFAAWVDGRGVVDLQVTVTRGRTDQAPLTLAVRQSGPPAPVSAPLPLVLHGPGAMTRRVDITPTAEPIELPLGDAQWIEVDPELTWFRRVRPDPAGDVNLDGVVDGMDLLDVAFAQGRRAIEDTELGPVPAADWDDRLDVDRDETISEADLDRLVEQFGQGW